MLDAATGFPPVTRTRWSLQDVNDRFVTDSQFAASRTRDDIWDDFELATVLLGQSVLLHAVWIGGSFISDKENPNDIDAVYVINARDLAKRTAAERTIVESFVDRECSPLGEIRPKHGLRVDSFLLRWKPYGQFRPNVDLEHQGYAASRGYWDDFWCRVRQGNKTQPVTWKDAIPRRGYLEVVINDFTR